MDAIGRMATAIAHDVGNVLVAISNYATVMQGHLQDDIEACDVLGKIQRAAEKGYALPHRMLSLARGGSAETVTVNLARHLEASQSLLRTLTGPEINVEIELADGAAEAAVELPDGAVDQILLNLAANATDAIDSQGKLTLRLTQDGDNSVLEVRDDGRGMSEDVLQKALEPFFTTKADGAHSGLGLATVYSIARSCGGNVEIESVAGAGTTVRVSLPQASNAAAEVFGAGDVKRHARILLVEDDHLARVTAEHHLKQAGHIVTTARSIAEAVEQAPKGLDLLLTDLALPDGWGSELAARLLESQPKLRVLFTSIHPQPTALPHAKPQLGAACLPKPASGRALLDAVAKALT